MVVAALAALGAGPAATATAKPLRNSLGISGTWGAGPTRSVFVRDSDYELWVLDQTGTTNTWTDLQAKTRNEDILGTVVSAVVQVSLGVFETHAFYLLPTTGSTNSIGHATRRGAGTTGGWRTNDFVPTLPFGVHVSSGLGVSSNVYRRGDYLEPQGSVPLMALYFIGTDNRLYTATYNNGSWTAWTGLGGPGDTIGGAQIDVTNEFDSSGTFITSVWVVGQAGQVATLRENRGPFNGARTWSSHGNYAFAPSRPAAVSWYDRTSRLPSGFHVRVNLMGAGNGTVGAFFREPDGRTGMDFLDHNTLSRFMSAGTYVGDCGGCMTPPQMSVVVARDDFNTGEPNKHTGNFFYLAKDNSHTDSFFVDTWTELPPVPMDGFSPFTRVDYGGGLGSVYVVSTTGRLIEYVPFANKWVNREFPNLAYSYTGYIFDVNDSRGYGGDGDWAVGDLKGECAANEWMTGVSTGGMTAPTHSVQCTSTDTAPSFTSGGHTLTISADNDGYGSHNVGDWDYGYFKGECAANEIVTGLSQSGGALNHVRCSGAARAIASNCRPLAIPTSDNRESPRNNNDWAIGYLKAECANGSAIAGVSRDVSTGATHAVLCCDFLAF